MLQCMRRETARSGPSRLAILTVRSHTLLGQRHVELDGSQLLGRLANALQKRQPARVELDVGEQGLDCNLSQSNRWKNFVETGGHSSN